MVTATGMASGIFTHAMGSGLFFDSLGDPLYGFHHPAEGEPRPTGVVIVHGAFEERQDAHRVLRSLAERLATLGHPVLRFDLYGHGDSAGEYRDVSLDHWSHDVNTAIATLAQQSGCTRVVPLGFRLGALVAANALRSRDAGGITVPAFLAWQPVTDGGAYLMDALRAHVASEMVMHRRAGGSRDALVEKLRAGQCVNVFGYDLSPRMWDEIGRLRLDEALRAVDIPTLALDFVRTDAAKSARDLADLATSLTCLDLVRIVAPQPLHTEGRRFLTSVPEAEATTARFLESHGERA